MNEIYLYFVDKHRSRWPLLVLPKRQILDSSKMKESADDNFKFDEKGRKFFKSVENTCYEQFLLFPQCFQKAFTADT